MRLPGAGPERVSASASARRCHAVPPAAGQGAHGAALRPGQGSAGPRRAAAPAQTVPVRAAGGDAADEGGAEGGGGWVADATADGRGADNAA